MVHPALAMDWVFVTLGHCADVSHTVPLSTTIGMQRTPMRVLYSAIAVIAHIAL